MKPTWGPEGQREHGANHPDGRGGPAATATAPAPAPRGLRKPQTPRSLASTFSFLNSVSMSDSRNNPEPKTITALTSLLLYLNCQLGWKVIPSEASPPHPPQRVTQTLIVPEHTVTSLFLAARPARMKSHESETFTVSSLRPNASHGICHKQGLPHGS